MSYEPTPEDLAWWAEQSMVVGTGKPAVQRTKFVSNEVGGTAALWDSGDWMPEDEQPRHDIND